MIYKIISTRHVSRVEKLRELRVEPFYCPALESARAKSGPRSRRAAIKTDASATFEPRPDFPDELD